MSEDENVSNEEELRSKVLIPYLKKLNIPISNIKLEKNFSVRLGHTVLDIAGNEKNRLSGRLDILVKDSDGKNLFIVELKSPNLELSDDDANQGISYARLLDQIAPFVIITNGRRSKVYDTITKSEISAGELIETDFWKNSRRLSTQEDLNIRFDAMQYFLGYSTENLQNFCIKQRERGMVALKGAQSNRKYNPSTYIKRKNVRDAISLFLKSDSVAFAILGESGVGKTNEMCSLAEELGSDNIVLFINATEISESIDRTLSNEFNWGFSENISFPEITRRLTRLGRELNKRVLIFVDSLDESEAINIERSISELASNIYNSNGVVKLIVSIKTSDWPRFSSLKGTISQLNLLLDKSWYSSDEDKSIDPHPFTLTTFNELEKIKAIEAYSKFYELLDFPEGIVKKSCNHPFLLRVVSELYSGGKDIPIDISEELLIETWIQKKLENTDEPQIYRISLVRLAQAIYEESIEKSNEYVTNSELWRASIETVIKNSNYSNTVNHLRKLEATGFTTVQQDCKGVSYYSFYYGPVRDYFIARYVLKLDEMSSDKMYDQLKNILDNEILRSSFFWHLRKAPTDHLSVLKSVILSRASEFINTYNKIFDNLFPNIKHCFPPYTNCEIGVCFRNSGEWLEYGFYPVSDVHKNNVVELNYSMMDKRSYEEIESLGAGNLKGGGSNFINEDPKRSAAKYVIKLINEAIEKGVLNESNVVELLQEGVVSIISTNDFLHKNTSLDRSVINNFPLDLDEIYKEIQLSFGRKYYENIWMRDHLEEQRKKNPSQTVFSYPRMKGSKRNEIEKITFSAVENGKFFDAPNINEYHDLKVICYLIVQLSAHKKIINNHVLPFAELKFFNGCECDYSNFSKEELIQYIEDFYIKAFDSYKRMIEYNFPCLLHKFENFKNIPNEIFVEINRDDYDNFILRYAFTKNDDKKIRVNVTVEPESSVFSDDQSCLLVDGARREYLSSGVSSFSYVFSPFNGPGHNVKSASYVREMPIRTFVYKQIAEDFKEINEEDLLLELDLIKVLK